MRRTSSLALATALLTAACGDDDGSSSATDASSTGGTAASTTTPVDPSTSEPPGTDGGTSGDTSATTAVSADSGTTEPPADTGSTTMGDDPTGLSFFVTSVGSGDAGGNLGGLEGADARCQELADAAGAGNRTWHAYLSTSTEDARDRIGTGPWYNAAGDMIAADVESLHADGLSNGDPQHALDENGNEVPANEHDILTGSQEDGTLLEGSTCDDWTSGGGGDQARVGHSDIPQNPMFSPSWNSAHDTPGCGPNDLANVGGAGRLYCFAID